MALGSGAIQGELLPAGTPSLCWALLVAPWTGGEASAVTQPGGPRRAGVMLLPPRGMAQRLGRLLGFKPFVGLGIIFSHFDADPLLLPLMLITRAERAKEAREDGRGADWLAWQTVLITTFMGNFCDDGLRLLITGMQIIDSKCALFSPLCGIPKAGIKKGHRRPNGNTQALFVRHLERTPF